MAENDGRHHLQIYHDQRRIARASSTDDGAELVQLAHDFVLTTRTISEPFADAILRRFESILDDGARLPRERREWGSLRLPLYVDRDGKLHRMNDGSTEYPSRPVPPLRAARAPMTKRDTAVARVEKAARDAASARAALTSAILAAVDAGASYRSIAQAAGLTHGRIAQSVKAARDG